MATVLKTVDPQGSVSSNLTASTKLCVKYPMQYWLFFWGGVGGDGLSNLLEHADNIESCDGVKRWRTRPVPSGKMAFHGPRFANVPSLFRNHHGFDMTKIHLLDYYIKLIEQGKNTIIPAHPWQYADFLEQFPQRDIIEKDQHKILLYTNDIDRMVTDFIDKNPTSEEQKRTLRKSMEGKNIIKDSPALGYQTYIDMDRVWKDWDYLNEILVNIGINLDRKYYEEYLDVAKKR